MLIVRRVLGAVGLLTGLFSLICVGMGVSYLLGLSPSEDGPVVNVMLTLFFGGVAGACFKMAHWGFKNPKPQTLVDDQDVNKQIRLILNLAQTSQGNVTLLEVAAETGLTIEQSRKQLEELVTQGIAQMTLDDEGVILYSFPDLRQAASEKPKYLEP